MALMFSGYEKLLIWRYLLPGAEGRIIVLVAGIGLTAVTIGVAALIIVMSVMNGARTKLAIQFAGVDGHASISRPGAQLADWRELEAEARRQADVLSAVPALDAPAMASVGGRVLPAAIRGLRPKDMQGNPLFEGDGRTLLGFLPREREDVVVGGQLAAALGITIGSPITIVRPAMEPEGELSLKSISYVVTGLVQTGIPKHDASLIVMNLGAAQQLLESGDVASRINISTASPDRVAEQLAPLKAKLQRPTLLQTWRELNKPIFDALALEHIGMFIAVSMIVLVAQFNILSSLMMLVGSKVRDIAIMRTMGASRTSILKIFVAVGTAIGSSGALLGSILGLSAVSAKDQIVAFLKAHVLRDTYTMELAVLIDLPARISAGETAGILVMTLAGTILATLYPAFRAAKVDPATVLRYE
jgi:lipoprotein-releasing system permease protein